MILLTRKIALIVLSVMAGLVLLGLIILSLVGLNGDKDKDKYDVPNYNYIRFDMAYEKEIAFDSELLKSNLKSNHMFSDYAVKDQYSMIYQITDEDAESEIKEYLGIESELPKIDYTERYLLLSVGRPIDNMQSGAEEKIEAGYKVFDIKYSDVEYKKDSLFVYSMSMTKIASGDILERYWWSNNLSSCNFYEPEDDKRELISEGDYHKLYKKSTGEYEVALYSATDKKLNRRLYSEDVIKVNEYLVSMIKIQFSDLNVYYDASRVVFSEDYVFNTEYLIYDIISYVRMKDGEIQLILRNAYNSDKYAKIIKLKFFYDAENLDTLVKSIEVVDNTHVMVEYYNEAKELVREKVEVYGLR